MKLGAIRSQELGKSEVTHLRKQNRLLDSKSGTQPIREEVDAGLNDSADSIKGDVQHSIRNRISIRTKKRVEGETHVANQRNLVT